jgi:carboxymethylenebutenolidase
MVGEALKSSGVNHVLKIYPAEHAFMRDEGPRYDSACADAVWAEAVTLFKRVLG